MTTTKKATTAKKSVAKKTVKKTVKRAAAKSNGNGNGNGAKKKEIKPLHQKLINLFRQKDGCSLTEVRKTGWPYPTMTALQIAKKHGFKVKATKKKGELTRYYAF
jgi:hypothetical protein